MVLKKPRLRLQQLFALFMIIILFFQKNIIYYVELNDLM